MEGVKVIATNRKARYEYHIGDRYEAGMVLMGTEVKSLRDGKANIQEAYCTVQNDEVLLVKCHIAPYRHGTHFNHDPERTRKLLLNRREISKLKKAVEQKGNTIVPLKLYFKSGLAKLEIGVATGKKQYDKRKDIADRESKRRLDRIRKDIKS
jgi:SsrA-binding protein